VQIRPKTRAADTLGCVQHVMMIVPVNSDVHEA